MISIDLSRYPLFNKLPNPESYIIAVLDQHHAVFKAQDISLITYTNAEIFSIVEETCKERLENVLTTMNETYTQQLNPLLYNLKSTTEELITYKSKLPCLDKSVVKDSVFENVLEEYLISNLSSNEYETKAVKKTDIREKSQRKSPS